MGFRNPLTTPPTMLADGQVIGISGSVPVVNAPASLLLTASQEEVVGTAAVGVVSLVVDLPANCQALRVVTGPDAWLFSVTGRTTGAVYSPILQSIGGGYASNIGAVEVDPALDPSVTVAIPAQGSGYPWYVVATLATEIVGTVGIEVANVGSGAPTSVAMQGLAIVGSRLVAGVIGDSTGRTFVIPGPPGISSPDHPPTEYRVASLDNVAATTNLLAAAGTGKRYRVYRAAVWALNVNSHVAAEPSAALTGIAAGPILRAQVVNTTGGLTHVLASPPFDFGDQGFPCPANVPIGLAIGGGSGQWSAMVEYTLETI